MYRARFATFEYSHFLSRRGKAHISGRSRIEASTIIINPLHLPKHLYPSKSLPLAIKRNFLPSRAARTYMDFLESPTKYLILPWHSRNKGNRYRNLNFIHISRVKNHNIVVVEDSYIWNAVDDIAGLSLTAIRYRYIGKGRQGKGESRGGVMMVVSSIALRRPCG